MRKMVDLRDFLEEIEGKGELVRIEEPLSVRHEIPEALRRFDGGKAVLFESLKEYGGSVVGGVCGTRPRILEALGVGFLTASRR